jgi:hypothetical protein
VLQVIGEQTAENSVLDDAITALRDALKETTRERVPLDWSVAAARRDCRKFLHYTICGAPKWRNSAPLGRGMIIAYPNDAVLCGFST